MSTEITFLKRLGYDVDIQDNLSNDQLAYLIEHENRIIINVDRFYLPNYVDAFGAQHFGFHCSNIIGFDVSDTNDRVFYAYEFLQNEPYTYSDSVLNNACFSECAMYSPKARTYIVGKSPSLIVDSNFFYSNLSETARNQLTSPNGMIAHHKGVINQLNKTKAFIRNPMLIKLEKSQLNLIKDSIRKSDALGTGYRLPHANGIKKIAKRFDDTELDKISNDWTQIATEWKQAGRTIFYNIPIIDMHSYWVSFFTDILQRETKLYEDIACLCDRRLQMISCNNSLS